MKHRASSQIDNISYSYPPTNTKQPISIAFLITNFQAGRGGLEEVLIRVNKNLSSAGISTQTLMLLPPNSDHFIKNLENLKIMSPINIGGKFNKYIPKLIYQPLWKRKFTKESSSFLQSAIKENNLDAIIVLNLSKNLIRITPCLKNIKKMYPHLAIIAWPHNSLTSLQHAEIPLLKNSFEIFDSVLAISNGLKKECAEIFNYDKAHVIYNPIPAPKFIPKRQPSRFIYIGRVEDPGKRVKELLQALQQLTGNWHLDIIGGTGSLQKDDEFMKYIETLTISQNITFHGWQTSPWDLITEAGVLLLNSSSEGFSLVLAEAIMRGIPCISTDCPVGPNEIIQKNINGWLYDMNDYDRLIFLLQGIINHSITLPPPELVIKSAERFTENNVMDNFKENILLTVKSKNNMIKDQSIND